MLDIHPAGLWSSATDVNDAGVILVEYGASGANHVQFTYHDGVVTELPLDGRARALAINNGGDIVGHVIENDVSRPFIYRNGELTVLPIDEFSARDINDAGDVVISPYILANVAYLYREGQWRESNPAGRPWISLSGINNNGIIIGSGRFGGPEWIPFKLTLKGDMNWDDQVNAFDIEPFIMALF